MEKSTHYIEKGLSLVPCIVWFLEKNNNEYHLKKGILFDRFNCYRIKRNSETR